MSRLGDRRILFLVGCVASVVIYLTWWTTYTITHQGDRYVQLAVGRPLETTEGTARLLSLAQTTTLLGDGHGSDPTEADPDAVWVVATVEITNHRANDRVWCGVELLSTTGRVWEKDSRYVARALPSCGDEDAVVGRPYRFEADFMVPVADVGRIAGLAFPDHRDTAHTAVLSPG